MMFARMASPLALLLLAIATLSLTVTGHRYPGYNFGIDTHARLAKRRMETGGHPFVFNRLAGAASGPRDLPLRREIRDLENNTEQWTLYILGLSMMQFTNQSDPASWYEVTGIHGVPFKTWGDVAPNPGNENTGYCTHVSVLFPTWHRPYLSMYENILYSMMSDVAALWSDDKDRRRYQRAIQNFRIPYWDWASNRTINGTLFPHSIGGNDSIEVDGPNGRQRIANPLYSYQFKPLGKKDFLDLSPWDVWQTTVRAPTSNISSAESNNSYVELTLRQNQRALKDRLNNLFKDHNYTSFSNAAWIPDQNDGQYDSLETLHDLVHNIAGGDTGHMAYIPFSAFDPVFFLHHANVDRLFAMWQALNPGSWVEPTKAQSPSYTISVGDIVDSQTNLTPFYATEDGGFYNSDMVRDPKWLGYSYAEVANFSLGSPSPDKNLQRHLRRTINRLYGQGTVPQVVSRLQQDKDYSTKPVTHSRVSSLIRPDGRYREWIANMHVNKQALRGPFSILLFLGDIPTDEDSSTWSEASNLVGSMRVFAAPNMPGHTMINHNISGTVPLTTTLTDLVLAGTVESLETEDVEPYLRENLKVAVVRAGDGVVFDPTEIPSLGIHVVSSEVAASESEEEFAEWGTFTRHFDLI